MQQHEASRQKEVKEALDWLSSGSPALSDHVACRSALRWPLWMDMLCSLHLPPLADAGAQVLARLEGGGFQVLFRSFPSDAASTKVADPKARLVRAAQVARACFRGDGREAIAGLEDELLRRAFAEAAGSGGLSGGAGSPAPRPPDIELPVLLVDDRLAYGVVAYLRLWRVDADRFSSEALTLVRSPASYLLDLDAAFRQSLENVNELLRRQPGLHGRPHALAWDLAPYEGGGPLRPLFRVGGGSLGAAIGLGALYALRDDLAEPLRDQLDGIDWRLVAVSAQLLKDDLLDEVTGLQEKYAAWRAFHGAPRAVFVSQRQPSIGHVEQHGAKDITELLRKVSLHASDLSPPQARLFRRLQSGTPLRGAEDRELLMEVDDAGQVRSLRGYLLQRLAHCAIAQGALFERRDGMEDLRFVNLTLTADSAADGRDPGRAQGDPSRDRPDRGPFRSLQQLLEADHLRDVGGWQITAEPGAGKSTLLRNYEFVKARQALQNWAAWSGPPEVGAQLPLLCLAVPASSLTSADRDFGRWLADRWDADWNRDRLPLKTLLTRYRVCFIIDGINEIGDVPGLSKKVRVRGIADWLDNQPAIAPPLFSVRTLEDEFSLAGRARLRKVRTARLLRWSPNDIEVYCRTWGERVTAKLLPALAPPDGDALRELCSLPLNLAAQCQMLDAGVMDRPATSLAELFSALLWVRLKREFGSLQRSGLLDDDSQLALSQVEKTQPSRQDLLALPRRVEFLRPLMALAIRMRPHGNPAVGIDSLKGVVPKRKLDAWLRAIDGLGIVEWDRLEKRVQFRHQLLWLEFFAALGLIGCKAVEWPKEIAAPALGDLEAARAQAVESEVGMRAPVTVWEETVKLAVQLTPAPAPWIEHLMACNPGLAGRAAARCLNALPAELLDRLRRKLMLRSIDPAVDLRLRVEAGLALGEVGDPRYVDARPDPTVGKRCLVLDDAHWINIPAGSYPVGSDEGEGETREQPVTVVALETFAIAWACVTNAEFRCFIDDGGYDDDRWWPGQAAHQWLIDQDRPIRRDDWSDNDLNVAAQPVVGVSLYEARAYARWLTAVSGGRWQYRLPREAEWEVAARRAAPGPARGRPAPGLEEAFNHRATGLGRTTPAGVFPSGSSVGEAADMLGNVWEWTVSPYTDQLERDELMRLDDEFENSDQRAVRGGSRSSPAAVCRPAFRYRLEPGDRGLSLGLRLARCPIPVP